MINSMIEAISLSLHTEFGDAYTIYAEEAEQGPEKPCFFVFSVHGANRLFLGNRYFRKQAFCIQYLPGDKGQAREECYETAERLYTCLEYIDIAGEMVHGTNMNFQLTDGALHFFVNYDLFVYRKDASAEEEAAEELAGNFLVKG